MKLTNISTVVSSSLLSCAIAIGALALAPAATAQSNSITARVDIPFAFQAGSQRMPAGTYHVSAISDHTLQLRGPGKDATSFVMVHSVEVLNAPNKGSVVFDRYGSRYYLHQVWTAGNTLGIECSKSRAEKETLQAANNQPATLVELALVNEPRH
jgi:hypothetical protein